MFRLISYCLLLAAMLLLSACGGGSDTEPDSRLRPAGTLMPESRAAAARFLTQATFGPTEADISDVSTLGYDGWIDWQLTLRPLGTHLAYMDARTAVIQQTAPKSSANGADFTHSFWQQALTGEDQLRQRIAFALSEIFVVSHADDCVGSRSRGLASYVDMLARHAFDDYRTLLEQVALHPVMGCYLSHLRNQKENAITGRVPDENFAREVMQLFSIGLYQLNPDGSLKLDAGGNPIDTYTADDISGLARVFTGFSFQCPGSTADRCFFSGSTTDTADPEAWVRPMVGYTKFHSASAKSFLGRLRVAAQTTADPSASIQAALQALADEHPNVGPFIGRQLIQRLVTSNPSPAYVARVSEAFETSGRNMGAMVKAILLDPEARDLSQLQSTTFGKVREPILRLSALLRGVGVQSDSGGFLIDPTDDPVRALAQAPLKAPSVFNFFRPGYVPPGSLTAAAGLVAPELQIAHESSTAAYVNFMRDVISRGVGRRGLDYKGTRSDVQPLYLVDASNPWVTQAREADASALVRRINDTLMYGTMSPALRDEIETAVESISFRDPAAPTAAEVNNRLWSALLLAVASPEFQIQQ